MKNIITKLSYLIFGLGYLVYTILAFFSAVGMSEFFDNKERYMYMHNGNFAYEDLAVVMSWVFLTMYVAAKINREKHNKSKYLYIFIPFIALFATLTLRAIF